MESRDRNEKNIFFIVLYCIIVAVILSLSIKTMINYSTANKYNEEVNYGDSSCPAGQFLRPDLKCEPCPVNNYCVGGVQPPRACSAGSYAGTGQSSCLSCPVGYACSGGTQTRCTAGTYSSGGATSCTNCQPGFYCPGGQSRVACSNGTYSTGYNSKSQSECATCPAGSYCYSGGKFDCPSGLSSPAGSYSKEQCGTNADFVLECSKEMAMNSTISCKFVSKNGTTETDYTNNTTAKLISNNENVITTNGFKITSKGIGGAVTLTASVNVNGETKRATATVKVIGPNMLTIGGASSVEKGSSIKLTANVSDIGSYTSVIEWSVSPDKIAKITQDGTLTGIAEGKVTVTAKVKGTDVGNSREISVLQPQISFSCISDYVDINAFTYCWFEKTGMKVNITNVSDTSIIDVSKSAPDVVRIRGKKYGKATITVSSGDPDISGEWSAHINVYDYPSKIVISGPSTIKYGETTKLQAKILPETANQSVTWETVGFFPAASISSDGVVTPNGIGEVTIKAKSIALSENLSTSVSTHKITIGSPDCNLICPSSIPVGGIANCSFYVNGNATTPSYFTVSNSGTGKIDIIDKNKCSIKGMTEGARTVSASLYEKNNQLCASHVYVNVSSGEQNIKCNEGMKWDDATKTCVVSNDPSDLPSSTPVTSVTISGGASVIKVNESTTFKATVQPSNASQDVVWSISGTGDGNINNGVFKATKEGQVVIKVASVYDFNKYSTKTITVIGSDATDCKAAGIYKSDGKCLTCPPGSFCKDGIETKQVCLAGTYSISGQSSCSSCPSGQFQPEIGKSFCLPCQDENGNVGEVNENKTTCSNASCNLTVTTVSKHVSVDSDLISTNSYYRVRVSVAGTGCYGKKLTYSATNAKSISPASVSSIAPGFYYFNVYPQNPCKYSKATAKTDDGKASDSTSSVIVLTDWDITDGEWTKEQVKDKPIGSHQADKEGVNEYFDGYNSNKGVYTIYASRRYCGPSTPPTSTGTSDPEPSFACYKDNNNNYTWASSMPNGYTLVTDVITQDECEGNSDDKAACYMNDDNHYVWAVTAPVGYKIVNGINDEKNCKKPLAPACYKNSQNDYQWTSTPPSGYTLVSSITEEQYCQLNDDYACFSDDSGNYVWGNYNSNSLYIKIDMIKNPEKCIRPPACYMNSNHEFVWGQYSSNSSYTLVNNVNSENDCNNIVNVPPTSARVSAIIYILIIIMLMFGSCTIYYVYNRKKFNF